MIDESELMIHHPSKEASGCRACLLVICLVRVHDTSRHVVAWHPCQLCWLVGFRFLVVLARRRRHRPHAPTCPLMASAFFASSHVAVEHETVLLLDYYYYFVTETTEID